MGRGKLIFIANGKPLEPDLVLSDKVKIALTGAYHVELWNTLTGEKQNWKARFEKERQSSDRAERTGQPATADDS